MIRSSFCIWFVAPLLLVSGCMGRTGFDAPASVAGDAVGGDSTGGDSTGGDPGVGDPFVGDSAGDSAVGDPTLGVPVIELYNASQTVTEESGSFEIAVSASFAAPAVVTIPYTVSGTSMAPDDHNLSSGTIVIDALASAAFLVVVLADDDLFEPPETLVVDLGVPTGATLGTVVQHTATIVDGDHRPRTIAVASDHSCALVSGGARCWGHNDYGQLGVSNVAAASNPVVTEAADVTSVAVGTRRTFAVVSGGLIGYAGGPGRVELFPAQSGAIDIAARGFNQCAVLDWGRQCWGVNQSGQLGLGDQIKRDDPVSVPGFEEGVTIVAVSNSHVCTKRYDDLYCSGNGTNGRLGLGSTDSFSTLQHVAAVTGTITAIDVAGSHSCAVIDAALYCWGSDAVGQTTLGGDTLTPTLVSGFDTVVTDVAVGGQHTCVLQDGGVQCWGSNLFGQAAQALLEDNRPPQTVTGFGAGSGVVEIAADDSQTCLATDAGEVHCWGSDAHGKLGDGAGWYEPTAVDAATGTNVIQVEGARGNGWNTCAIDDTVVFCWGANFVGQLGDGGVLDTATPSIVPGISSGATDIAVGEEHVCALIGGGVWCWGQGGWGQLGVDAIWRTAPVQTSGMTTGVSDITAAQRSTCVVHDPGGGREVWCWGVNNVGQLGDGTQMSRSSPAAVATIPVGADIVSAGTNTVCAAVADEIYCWGENFDGQCGNGTTGDQVLTPTLVQGLPGIITGITDIAGGNFHSCAIVNDDLYCWGINYRGALGRPTDGSMQAELVVGLPVATPVTEVAAAGNTTCAVAGGNAYCWGYGAYGQLGAGTLGNTEVPTNPTGLDTGTVESVALGGTWACAIDNGILKCWGSNAFGQLGDASLVRSTDPVQVTGL